MIPIPLPPPPPPQPIAVVIKQLEAAPVDPVVKQAVIVVAASVTEWSKFTETTIGKAVVALAVLVLTTCGLVVTASGLWIIDKMKTPDPSKIINQQEEKK